MNYKKDRLNKDSNKIIHLKFSSETNMLAWLNDVYNSVDIIQIYSTQSMTSTQYREVLNVIYKSNPKPSEPSKLYI